MKKKEPAIDLTKEQKNRAAALIKEYLQNELDLETGGLQASIFLDYITENIGIYYYNKALADSMKFMTEKIDDLYLLMKDEEF